MGAAGRGYSWSRNTAAVQAHNANRSSPIGDSAGMAATLVTAIVATAALLKACREVGALLRVAEPPAGIVPSVHMTVDVPECLGSSSFPVVGGGSGAGESPPQSSAAIQHPVDRDTGVRIRRRSQSHAARRQSGLTPESATHD